MPEIDLSESNENGHVVAKAPRKDWSTPHVILGEITKAEHVTSSNGLDGGAIYNNGSVS